MKTPLGKIHSVSIREIWPNEASDFTPWLAKPENLEKLGDTIGVSFGPSVQQEVHVGPYRVDILAKENSTAERNIIIENQYGQTNHDHLGKIITYASGKQAKIVIWIAEKADDEHKSAIRWLNDNTKEESAFFLVTIKLIKIDNSNPAPIFELAEGPNDWDRVVRYQDGMSDSQKERLNFWERFIEFSSKNKRFVGDFSNRKAGPRFYLDLIIKDSRYHFYLAYLKQKGRQEYAVTTWMINQKGLYNHLKQNADAIENEIGAPLVWKESNKACTARLTVPASEFSSDEEVFDWYIATAFKFKEVFAKYAK